HRNAHDEKLTHGNVPPSRFLAAFGSTWSLFPCPQSVKAKNAIFRERGPNHSSKALRLLDAQSSSFSARGVAVSSGSAMLSRMAWYAVSWADPGVAGAFPRQEKPMR